MDDNNEEPVQDPGQLEENNNNDIIANIVANPDEEANQNQDERNEDEWIELVAEQLVEWNVTQEELYGLVSVVHSDFNEVTLRGSLLIQPAIMRCITEQMDFETLKNLRRTGKIMKRMVDPYFYKRGTFMVQDSTEFYKFIKKSNTENHLIPVKMRRIQFSGDIDLFEVSRVMYRARSNLKELSVFTTAPKLRGEFQNIAGILPVMEKLHTLRLNLPRRYLLHQLFRSTPLTTIKTLHLNFENAHPVTITGIFNVCASVEFLEMSQDQIKHLAKLTAVVPMDVKRCRSKKSTSDSDFQIFKISRNEEVKKKQKKNSN